MSFEKSLEFGLTGEKYVRDVFMSYLSGGEEAVEVKTQTASLGNVYIEIESWGRPAGICASKAPYWCIIIPHDTMIIIKREHLWRLMLTCQLVNGGDQHNSWGYSVPIEKLVRVK